MRGHSMLRFHGLALRACVLLSLLSTGCCSVHNSTCGTGCGPEAWMANHACSNGCGEFYIDEWYNHPPQCDPCNTCGDYVGQHAACGCGEPTCVPLLHRLSCLWGIRYVGPGCDAGCSTCSGGAAMMHEGHVVHSGHSSGCASCASGGHASHVGPHAGSHGGEVIYDGPVRNMAPKAAPSAQPTPAKPTTPPAASPMPDAGTTTRSTSPALRKKSAIQQASAQQPVRRK
jgi:hypothetical protein